ncbi:MAG: Glu-tRNA(Gln) amidotransferase subunit GatE [Euryarchaeota archaeon]|nr:Glu-tRNA(Gln) amidotransferase subunit GatE [Euryarchaeota archaeon]MBT3847542.1 Glu-tRNA(Gln) amidotransferase subunit GatE [Euryarchaeota archaeon]MBT4155888.1 Glu-tRNA(Gln) amidotransferase subunit GatE [Euryarchaeota archaeon]MBT6075794.1 Glu-tRNA(Gln) amidotransferase subunit GatE [Euryarchaeota archaeon]MBT7820897.1 Glu-tRNA(Gln) amidotransferase subunit GatE [Euryarchaeota archaeon]
MEPMGDISSPDNLSPEGLGFMCGLEIHQQLATGKLHSRMPSELYDFGLDEIPNNWPRSHRKLRAAQGEGGRIDVTARFESERNRSFVYVQSPNSGLIELDEAPPLNHDNNAVDAVLTMAAMMNAKPVSSMQAMRKTVVDGSNTSGFQRTTLVATNGVIDTNLGTVGIDVICLEEDSARKLETESTSDGEIVFYTLDRLGVPLVEIATAPDIQTPEHAKEVALMLGTLLRDTRRVRRGLGSIRQDLNVSIACGVRVEIKGCQDLEWVPQIIKIEMARQLHMYRLANELRKELELPLLPPDRRLDSIPVENRVALSASSKLPFKTEELTNLFVNSNSEMVVKALSMGSVVLGLKLQGFAGKIGTKELDENGAQMPRLGRELASSAKQAGVAGIFHSDELPAYGITSEDVDVVRNELQLSDSDAFILCVAPKWQAELALESVLLRARRAFHRIPGEVRNVVIRKGAPEDGTTTAMRPLPSGARMYPETDIQVLNLELDRWDKIQSNLPMNKQQRLLRLQKYDISSNQVEAILGSELDDIFISGLTENELSSPSLTPKPWASILLDNSRSEISNKSNVPVSNVPWELLALLVYSREKGIITREGIVPLGSKYLLSIDEDFSTFDKKIDWISKTAEIEGFIPADSSSVEKVIDVIIADKLDFIQSKGMAAIGPLMGMVMAKLGGSADGKLVNSILLEKIKKISQ